MKISTGICTTFLFEPISRKKDFDKNTLFE
jgi:hypothetical protein